jgi:hypothetical protein
VHLSRADGAARTWRQMLDFQGEVLVAPLQPPDPR